MQFISIPESNSLFLILINFNPLYSDDFPVHVHIDTISMKLPIEYSKRSQVDISKV